MPSTRMGVELGAQARKIRIVARSRRWAQVAGAAAEVAAPKGSSHRSLIAPEWLAKEPGGRTQITAAGVKHQNCKSAIQRH
jgi:hypothetical protein